MNRSHKKHSSSSFNKFVVQLQRTFSSKNTKSSTFIVSHPSQLVHPNSTTFRNQVQLSNILYHPTRPNEYLNEVKDDSGSCSSYHLMNVHHDDPFNLSQMNISMNNSYDHCSPQKSFKRHDSNSNQRLHSTAIHDLSHH